MGKWFLIIITIILLTSCALSSNNKSYYQIPVMKQKVIRNSTNQSSLLLCVEQVTLSDFLARSGLAYQTSDVQYVIASNNLWASPLDQQLRDTLVFNLSNRLPDWLVTSLPLDSNQKTLNVNITGFHGRHDGCVVISGEWLLNYQGQLTKQPFYLEIKQQQDGYDTMVRTLAQGWAKEADHIALVLTHLTSMKK